MLKLNFKFLALAALICNAPLAALTQEDGQRVATRLEQYPVLEAQLQELEQKIIAALQQLSANESQKDSLSKDVQLISSKTERITAELEKAQTEYATFEGELMQRLTELNAQEQSLQNNLAEAKAYQEQLKQRQLALDKENRTMSQINQANETLNQELDQIVLEIKEASAGDNAVLDALDRLQQTTLPHTDLIKVHQEERQGLAEQMNKLRKTLMLTP